VIDQAQYDTSHVVYIGEVAAPFAMVKALDRMSAVANRKIALRPATGAQHESR
jgi:hypothetical protein